LPGREHLPSASRGGAAATARSRCVTAASLRGHSEGHTPHDRGSHSQGVCSAVFGLHGDGEEGALCRDVGIDALARIDQRKSQCRGSRGRHSPVALESIDGRPRYFWR
jgi:hypothetical protein